MKKINIFLIIFAIFIVAIFHFIVFFNSFGPPADNIAYIHFSDQIKDNQKVNFFESYWQKDPTLYLLAPFFFIYSCTISNITGIDVIYVNLILTFIQYLVIALLSFLLLKKYSDVKWIILLSFVILIVGLFFSKNILTDLDNIYSKIAYSYTLFFFLICVLLYIDFFRNSFFQILILISGFLFHPLGIIYFIIFLVPIVIIKPKWKIISKILISFLIYFLTITLLLLLNKNLLKKLISQLSLLFQKDSLAGKTFVSDTSFTKLIVSFPPLLIMFFTIGILLMIYIIIREGKDKLEYYGILTTLIISLMLGWVISNPINLKFEQTFIFICILISPLLLYIFLNKFKLKKFKIIIVAIIVILIIIGPFWTLSTINKDSEKKWLLSWEYINYIRSQKLLFKNSTYISDTVTNYVFSGLTSSNTSFYSMRSNPREVCDSVKQGNLESKNNKSIIEISNFFNLKEINTTILKENAVDYIVYDNLYIDICRIKPDEMTKYLNELISKKKITKLSCNIDERICIYKIN